MGCQGHSGDRNLVSASQDTGGGSKTRLGWLQSEPLQGVIWGMSDEKAKLKMPKIDNDPQESAGGVSTKVEIGVFDWLCRPLEASATVTLRREGETSDLTREGSANIYSGSVPAGTYDLVVSSDQHESPPRQLAVGTTTRHATAYVGERGWPFYRLGENAIPFDPPGPLLAVAFPDQRPDPEEAEELSIMGKVRK